MNLVNLICVGGGVLVGIIVIVLALISTTKHAVGRGFNW